jgi:hypothetical protein
VCRHTRGRGRGGLCGHRRCVTNIHTLHRRFFSESLECQNAGFGVAEDTLNCAFGNKTGEAISVLEASRFCHSRMMTGLQDKETRKTPGNDNEKVRPGVESYPLTLEKSHYFVLLVHFCG